MDRREWILQRIQDVIATLAPGVKFPFPSGSPAHREIVTDLGGRAYSRPMPDAEEDASGTPFAEVRASAQKPDSVEATDDDWYSVTLPIEVWGFIKAGDQGDGRNSTVRAALNAFRADLIVALESVPYWAPAESPQDTARRRTNLAVLITHQYTNILDDDPSAWLVIEAEIRYRFHRLNP